MARHGIDEEIAICYRQQTRPTKQRAKTEGSSHRVKYLKMELVHTGSVILKPLI
jgi:hypothetical protein